MVSTKLGNAFIEIVDAKSFSAALADEIVASINEAVSEKGKCYIALAGGSTPSATYRLLSRPPRVKEIPWSKVYFFWGDERWAPHDSAQSNYRMTQETLFSVPEATKSQVFPVDTALENPNVAAKAYADKIVSTIGCDDSGIPVFDLVLLGMGDDGHTASLFPESQALTSQEICVATDRPDGLQAITLTKTLLTKAERAIFIVSGENKANILQLVLEQNMPYAKAPAALYRDMKGRVIWFLDTAAAMNLEKRLEESA